MNVKMSALGLLGQIAVRTAFLGGGITLCVLSHGVLSPMLYEGVLCSLMAVPGLEPPIWAFAIPLI